DEREPLRYTDATLLRFLNQIVVRMAMLRPDLFLVVRSFVPAPGSTYQQLPPDAVRLVEVYAVDGGSVITEVNREFLDQTLPSWRSAPSGTPINYMRHVRNPTAFFLYPAPAEGVTLTVEYAAVPAPYAMNDVIVAPSNAYFSALVDGVVFLAQSIDDEHVNSGRAKLFGDTFAQALDATLAVRSVTDTEAAGRDPRQVV
ncbi:DUF6682 family protein, partial [Arthrospira platensis SPKY2]